MFVKTVNLWENTPGMCEETPTLDIYIPEKKTSEKAIVICPGGGYSDRAPHEGKDYAEFLNSHGITAFVCQYRVHPHKFPLPLLDARRAIRYVRFHAEEFGIGKDKVYIMGSSAGGHLAAMTSTYHKPIDFEGMDEIDEQDHKPNGQILCYPVIMLRGKHAHQGSGMQLLGNRLEEMGDALSPDMIADETTPKAFIWHAFDDVSVDVENSMQYVARLREMKVSTEFHIYPYGGHGQGLATQIPLSRNWPYALLEWLNF